VATAGVWILGSPEWSKQREPTSAIDVEVERCLLQIRSASWIGKERTKKEGRKAGRNGGGRLLKYRVPLPSAMKANNLKQFDP